MIAVTGGAGFIGSVLVWKLNELGHKDILVVDEHAQNSPKWRNVEKRAFGLYLDSEPFIQQLEAGKFDGKITAIFHMGACSDTTEMDVQYLRRNNSEYTERIAKWCMKNHAYLAYASSAATYGNGDLGFSDEDWKNPSLRPLNPYGQSKLDFDLWMLKNGYEKAITGLRFFNVYGPNEYHKGGMRSMVQKGFEQIRAEGKIRLFKSYKKEYADGGQMRDFIYVKDVVDAMIWFYQNPSMKGIYNLGAGKAQSWNELAEALFKAMGREKDIEYVEMPDSLKNQYQYFTQADLKKLMKTGCPVRFMDLEKGVGDYVLNYLSKPDSYL